MANEIVAVTTAIAAVMGGISGIRQAPVNPNETQNIDPFAVTYLAAGRLDVGPIGTRKGLYTIAIDLFTVRTDLARNLELLNPFVDSVQAALLAEVSSGGDLFSATIQTFGAISVQFLPSVDYAGVQMIGYRFTLEEVKILVNL